MQINASEGSPQPTRPLLGPYKQWDPGASALPRKVAVVPGSAAPGRPRPSGSGGGAAPARAPFLSAAPALNEASLIFAAVPISWVSRHRRGNALWMFLAPSHSSPSHTHTQTHTLVSILCPETYQFHFKISHLQNYAAPLPPPLTHNLEFFLSSQNRIEKTGFLLLFCFICLFVFLVKGQKECVSAPRTATSFVVWGCDSEKLKNL